MLKLYTLAIHMPLEEYSIAVSNLTFLQLSNPVAQIKIDASYTWFIIFFIFYAVILLKAQF